MFNLSENVLKIFFAKIINAVFNIQDNICLNKLNLKLVASDCIKSLLSIANYLKSNGSAFALARPVCSKIATTRFQINLSLSLVVLARNDTDRPFYRMGCFAWFD